METETAGVNCGGGVTTGHSRALKHQMRASMSAAEGLAKVDLKSHSA